VTPWDLWLDAVSEPVHDFRDMHDGSVQIIERDEPVSLEHENDAEVVQFELDLFVRGFRRGLILDTKEHTAVRYPLGSVRAAINGDRQVFDRRVDQASIKAIGSPTDPSEDNMVLPMLIAVGDRGEDGEWVFQSPFPSVVRLEAVDDLPVATSDSLQHPLAMFPVVPLMLEDRELRARAFGDFVSAVDDKLEDKVIQDRARLDSDTTELDCPIGIRVAVDVGANGLTVAVTLNNDPIWQRLHISSDFIPQRIEFSLSASNSPLGS
jgi:hypothetical protein